MLITTTQMSLLFRQERIWGENSPRQSTCDSKYARANKPKGQEAPAPTKNHLPIFETRAASSHLPGSLEAVEAHRAKPSTPLDIRGSGNLQDREEDGNGGLLISSGGGGEGNSDWRGTRGRSWQKVRAVCKEIRQEILFPGCHRIL